MSSLNNLNQYLSCQHHLEDSKYICKNFICDQKMPLCGICVICDHKEHDIMELNDYISNKYQNKNFIKSQIEDLKQLLNDILSQSQLKQKYLTDKMQQTRCFIQKKFQEQIYFMQRQYQQKKFSDIIQPDFNYQDPQQISKIMEDLNDEKQLIQITKIFREQSNFMQQQYLIMENELQKIDLNLINCMNNSNVQNKSSMEINIDRISIRNSIRISQEFNKVQQNAYDSQNNESKQPFYYIKSSQQVNNVTNQQMFDHYGSKSQNLSDTNQIDLNLQKSKFVKNLSDTSLKNDVIENLNMSQNWDIRFDNLMKKIQNDNNLRKWSNISEIKQQSQSENKNDLIQENKQRSQSDNKLSMFQKAKSVILDENLTEQQIIKDLDNTNFSINDNNSQKITQNTDFLSSQLIKLNKSLDSKQPILIIASSDKYIAMGGSNNLIEIYDTLTQNFLKSIKVLSQRVKLLTFMNQNPNHLVSVNLENFIQVWNVDTSICINQIVKTFHLINQVTISSDDKLLLLSGIDNYVHVQDLANYQYKSIYSHKKTIKQIKFSKDNNQIISVSDDKTLKVWDTKDLQFLRSVEEIIFTKSNGQLFDQSFDMKNLIVIALYQVLILNYQNLMILRKIDTGSQLSSILYLPNNYIVYGFQDGQLKITCGVEHLKNQSESTHTTQIVKLQHNNQTNIMISMSDDNKLNIWQTSF